MSAKKKILMSLTMALVLVSAAVAESAVTALTESGGQSAKSSKKKDSTTEAVASIVQRPGDPVVLFKVNKIEPIKNVEDVTSACSFDLVFYNRSDLSIKGASLRLIWNDDVVENAIAAEKKALEDGSANKRSTVSTQATTPKTIEVDVSLPPLSAFKQLVSNVKINTNRCFLLIEDLNFKVSSCKATSDKGEIDCLGMFKFVSIEDPEYYSEFKATAYENQVKEELSSQQKDRAELTELYNKTVSALNKTVSTAGQLGGSSSGQVSD